MPRMLPITAPMSRFRLTTRSRASNSTTPRPIAAPAPAASQLSREKGRSTKQAMATTRMKTKRINKRSMRTSQGTRGCKPGTLPVPLLSSYNYVLAKKVEPSEGSANGVESLAIIGKKYIPAPQRGSMAGFGSDFVPDGGSQTCGRPRPGVCLRAELLRSALSFSGEHPREARAGPQRSFCGLTLRTRKVNAVSSTASYFQLPKRGTSRSVAVRGNGGRNPSDAWPVVCSL